MPFAVAGPILGAAVGSGISALTKGGQSRDIAGGEQAAIRAQQEAQAQMRSDLMPFMRTGWNALMGADVLSGAAGGPNQDPRLTNAAALASGIFGEQARRGGPVQDVYSDLTGVAGPAAAAHAFGNFYTSPGYQFRLNEGIRGVENSAAARGMLRSGSTLKAITDFAEGKATDEYGNYLTNARQAFGDYYSRANDQFGSYYNKLYNLATLGQSSAAGVGQQGVRTAEGIASTEANAAAAQANLTGNFGNAIGKAVNGLFSNPNVNDWFKGLVRPAGDLSNFAPTPASYEVAQGYNPFGGTQYGG